jgi:hypothetical protein
VSGGAHPLIHSASPQGWPCLPVTKYAVLLLLVAPDETHTCTDQPYRVAGCSGWVGGATVVGGDAEDGVAVVVVVPYGTSVFCAECWTPLLHTVLPPRTTVSLYAVWCRFRVRLELWWAGVGGGRRATVQLKRGAAASIPNASCGRNNSTRRSSTVSNGCVSGGTEKERVGRQATRAMR